MRKQADQIGAEDGADVRALVREAWRGDDVRFGREEEPVREGAEEEVQG